jgi:hypothetical protein
VTNTTLLIVKTHYGLQQQVWFFAEAEKFIFVIVPRLPLECTQLLIQWVLGTISLEVKQPGHDADHPPPPSAEILALILLTSSLYTGTTFLYYNTINCNLTVYDNDQSVKENLIGNMFLQEVGTHLPDYTASQPKVPQLFLL